MFCFTDQNASDLPGPGWGVQDAPNMEPAEFMEVVRRGGGVEEDQERGFPGGC